MRSWRKNTWGKQMGIFEWVLLGAMYAVVLTVFFIPFALEVKKSKQLRGQITQEILRSKMKASTWISLMILAIILLIGAPMAVILFSLLIAPIPRGAYAAIMAVSVVVGIGCLYETLAAVYNSVYATEEGVWVRSVFLKTKFYRYEEVASMFMLNGTIGHVVFFKAGGKKIFSLSHARDTNVVKMIALLREHSPHLGKLKENELFRM